MMLRVGWFLVCWMLWSVPASAVEIIAHRGASFDAPENTLAAFRMAWEQQADANELDLYLTRDNQPVVIHDATTRRTTGMFGYVQELRLRELRELDAGGWKQEQYRGETIPTLAEVLALTPPGKQVWIEIKCGPEVLPVLQQTLAQSSLAAEQIVLIGFHYETLRAAHALLPQLKCFWVVSAQKSKSTGQPPALDDLIRRAQAAGFAGLDLDARFELNRDDVQRIHAAQLAAYVWTVNRVDVARRWQTLGIDGITTDRPGWLRAELARPESP